MYEPLQSLRNPQHARQILPWRLFFALKNNRLRIGSQAGRYSSPVVERNTLPCGPTNASAFLNTLLAANLFPEPPFGWAMRNRFYTKHKAGFDWPATPFHHSTPVRCQGIFVEYCRVRSVEDAVRTGEEHRRKIAGATGFVLSRAASSFALVARRAMVDSVEDAVGRVTGDKVAGAIGGDVKLRAERKLGGRAEALTPHRLRGVFISFGGRCGPWNTPSRLRLGIRFRPADDIESAPDSGHPLEPFYRSRENALINRRPTTENQGGTDQQFLKGRWLFSWIS